MNGSPISSDEVSDWESRPVLIREHEYRSTLEKKRDHLVAAAEEAFWPGNFDAVIALLPFQLSEIKKLSLARNGATKFLEIESMLEVTVTIRRDNRGEIKGQTGSY